VYPLSLTEDIALQKFIAENLEKGYIRQSKSPYAFPFFFIKKKNGDLRPIQDYRRLNAFTVRNTAPLPLIRELMDRLMRVHGRRSALFTKLDIRWGYNNIRMRDGDQWKAAFKTNHGLFEPMVMFFGLTNAPATFQFMMNHLFRELIDEGYVTIYMDNILIHTPNDPALHRRVVNDVLRILAVNDLYLKPQKCQFEQPEVEYLGVIISEDSIAMDPIKVQGVKNWK
jgi:Reverse transcriptase (RNA-dependent DNA polymerase)